MSSIPLLTISPFSCWECPVPGNIGVACSHNIGVACRHQRWLEWSTS